MKELKKLRESLGWTQEKLGRFLGYAGRGSISNIETGKETMGHHARRLLELLRIYGKDAPRLWLPEIAKKIKQILREKTDE